MTTLQEIREKLNRLEVEADKVKKLKYDVETARVFRKKVDSVWRYRDFD